MVRRSPRELVLDRRVVVDAQISPDGAQTAFVVEHLDGQGRRGCQLWLASTTLGAIQRVRLPATADGVPADQADVELGSLSWSPGSDQVAVSVAGRSGHTVMTIPAGNPGPPRAVAAHPLPILAVAWSPDRTKIAYSAVVDPDQRLLADGGVAPPLRLRRLGYKLDGAGLFGNARPQLFVIDLAHTARPRQLTAGDQGVHQIRWSPDGRFLAVTLGDLEAWSARLALVEIATSDVQPLTDHGERISSFCYSPDGSQIAFVSSPPGTVHRELYCVTIASAAKRRVSTDSSFAFAEGPFWRNPRDLIVHTHDHGTSALRRIDVGSGRTTVLLTSPDLQEGLSVDRDGSVAAQISTGPDSAGTLLLHDLNARSSTELFRATEEPGASVWQKLQVVYDGRPIDGWVVSPADTGNVYPLVVQVHGGPESMDGRRYDPMREILVRNGFVVLAVNPRGSTGYGQAFTDANHLDWGPGPFSDVEAVLDRACELRHVDAGRVGIQGVSYGGYLTAWAVTHSSRFRSAVAVSNTSDLVSQYLAGQSDYAYGDIAWGGSPAVNPALYLEQSPVFHVTGARTPTLIMHGEQDHCCPITQGEELFAALRKAGCPVEFVRYPGVGHNFPHDGPAAVRVDVLSRILEWHTRHLGGVRLITLA